MLPLWISAMHIQLEAKDKVDIRFIMICYDWKNHELNRVGGLNVYNT